MAQSPSQKWEDGRLVERAIETNRHRVAPDGSELGEVEEVEPKATKPYKAPVATKRVADAENKAVAAAETKKPAKRAAKKK